jgi:hypothetical protein
MTDAVKPEKAGDGLATALDMLVDGRLRAVMIVGVYNDGRGYKIWEDGDTAVADQVKAGLTNILPLKVPNKLVQFQEDDGA